MPNIVIMFMDDMGYADIGPFGAKAYPTPHLDKMALEGENLLTSMLPRQFAQPRGQAFSQVATMLESESMGH